MDVWHILRGGAPTALVIGLAPCWPTGSRELTGLTSVAVWRYPDSVIDYVVPLPDEYVRSAIRPDGYVGQFAAFHGRGSAVAWPDTILSAMSGLNEVFLSTREGSALDTLHPPAIRRRGVPEDIQERVDANDVPVGVHEFSSSLTGLYRLSSGATALFHHDAMLEGEPGRGTITADIYLTVIAPDLGVVSDELDGDEVRRYRILGPVREPGA